MSPGRSAGSSNPRKISASTDVTTSWIWDRSALILLDNFPYPAGWAKKSIGIRIIRR